MNDILQDKILTRFLANSFITATELAARSDTLRILAHKGNPPTHFLLMFDELDYFIEEMFTGRIKRVSRQPVMAEVIFPADYLRSVDPHLYMKISKICTPGFFHPNVSPGIQNVCLGQQMISGAPLKELIYHLYDIVTYRNMTIEESNALNPAACRYFREYGREKLVKLTRPPLIRRALKVSVSVEDLRNGRSENTEVDHAG